jgi:predicted  nucleic acid-binding Zn-ribbon protein
MTPVKAQVATIASVSTPVYPGEPVTVTLTVLQGNVLLNVTLASDSVPTYVWASQAVYAAQPGTYVVTLTLPKLLPGLSSPPTLYVIVYLGATPQDVKSVPIYPKIEVSPPKTTNVDETGATKSVTVSGYGFDNGATVSAIIFDNLNYPGTVYSVPVSITVGPYGNFSTTIALLPVTGVGLAGGSYNVTATVSGASYLTYLKNATLEILPQAVIYASPNSPIIEPGSYYGRVYAHGRCDTLECEYRYVYVYLYGFPPRSSVPTIQLVNRNYTGVNYNFTLDPTTNVTNANGFLSINLGTSPVKFNMSAGDYYVVVQLSPAAQTFTNTTTIDLGKVGTVTLSLPNGAKVSARSYVSGRFDYVVKSSDTSLTITDTLRIDFTYGGYSYRLAANWNVTTGNVTFALYNTSTLPYIQLFNVSVPSAYNATIGANVSVIYFNITATGAPYSTSTTDTPPSPPGSYVFWASFYGYPNQILLVLRQYQFVLSYANLTITLTAPDGTVFSWYYEYPGNYTFDGASVLSAKVSQTYGGYEYRISFSYDASTKSATLTVTLRSLITQPFPFLNQYYLVRPILIVLSPLPAPGPYMPGQALVVAAYGYGPSYPWTTVIPNAPFLYNNLTIRLDLTVLNASLPLGRDGNATYAYVYLPSQLTFGVHYLKGTDSWGYEYTEAIIIGVAAYWAKIVWGKYSPDNRVSAGYYNNARIEACPCPESLGVVGMKYCGSCAIYAGDCDYLGDYVEVVVSGLAPGENVSFYFGGVYRGSAIADANGVARIVFVVPTLPRGTYVIYVVGNITGYKEVTTFYNGTAFLSGVNPVVYPKILLVDLGVKLGVLADNSTTRVALPVIVGSGIVKVVGTGFTPGVQFIAVLINNTDATASVNTNVGRWNANSDGILVAYSVAGRVIEPGLWIPMMEPGKYLVELLYLPPGSATAEVTMGGYVFVINNISIMATKDDLAKATSQVLSSLSALDTKLSSSLTEISGRLDTAISQLGSLSGNISGLSSKLEALASAVSALSSDLSKTRSDILSAISSIDAKVTALQTAVSTARSDILSAISALDAKVSAVSSKLDTLTTSLANVTTGLSTVLSQLKDLSDKMSATLATLTTTVTGLSTKIDTVTATVSDLKSAVATISSKVDSVSAAVSDLKSAVGALQTSVSKVADAVNSVSGKVDTVSSKVDTVSSKIDSGVADLKKSLSDTQTTLSSQLSTASIVLYIATVLALLAFVFSLLAYLSMRKATAAK